MNLEKPIVSQLCVDALKQGHWDSVSKLISVSAVAISVSKYEHVDLQAESYSYQRLSQEGFRNHYPARGRKQLLGPGQYPKTIALSQPLPRKGTET